MLDIALADCLIGGRMDERIRKTCTVKAGRQQIAGDWRDGGLEERPGLCLSGRRPPAERQPPTDEQSSSKANDGLGDPIEYEPTSDDDAEGSAAAGLGGHKYFIFAKLTE